MIKWCAVLILLLSSVAMAAESEVRISCGEPKAGAVFNPGSKVYFSLNVDDPAEKVKSLAFTVTAPGSNRSGAPVLVAKSASGRWIYTWAIPPAAQEGSYRIRACGLDDNGEQCGKEVMIPLEVRRSLVKLIINTPARGEKFLNSQEVAVSAELQDTGGAVRRVEFYLYPDSETSPSPIVTVKKLLSSCSARLRLPEDARGGFEVAVKAFGTEKGGAAVAEARTRILAGRPDVGLTMLEPLKGSVFYPGQKVYFYARMEDPAQRVKEGRFYFGKNAGESDPAPLTIKKGGEVKGEFNVPYKAEIGRNQLMLELLDGSGELVASLATALTINKPVVNLTVRVPAQGAYYYPGEQVSVTVGIDDRAGIVTKVGYMIFPKGDPMAVMISHYDRALTHGSGMAFELPGDTRPGWYVLQVTARDGQGASLCQKTVNFEIRK